MSIQQADNTSHKQILKSTGIIGGEQIIILLAGIVRGKVVALLLGPVGVGLAGLYQSTIDLVRNGTGLGLGFSAVRDVAESAGTGDEKEVSKIILILRRWVWATGLIGMALVLLFCRTLSEYAFGDDHHAWPFALLSVTVLLSSVSSGQLALLQGLRKIAYLAKANVASVVAGLAVAIPLYWRYRNDGIVYAMIAVAALGLLFSWIYAGKIRTVPVKVGVRDTISGGLGMAKLGFFMVLTGLLSTGTMFAIRILIKQKLNLDAVGQFQAAWTISSVYLAAVLNAMGADYFPRLSSVQKDNARINVLVNEQTEIALLIAGPLIICMLSFSHVLVQTLYSSKFERTIDILQWQILGSYIKVISWPIGFVFLARRKVVIFALSEVLWNVLYFGMIVGGWKVFGIEITGISFLISYALSITFIFHDQEHNRIFLEREKWKADLHFRCIRPCVIFVFQAL